MNRVFSLIEKWVDKKLIPDAVIQINIENKVIAQKAFGHATINTLFDVASLTKVTATLPSLLILLQSSKLALDDKLSQYIPQFKHDQVSLLDCLMHRTGLPGSLPYPQNRYSTADVWQEICSQPLLSKPGEETRYSDLGMILAGLVVEKVANESLASFSRRHVFELLGMKYTQFNPSKQKHSAIAPTEWDKERERYLQGEVHDEIAFRLGGVSGSAGLFSTVEDLSLYASAWLYPERYALLTYESVRQSISSPVESRGLAWQVQDFKTALACGVNWPAGSFGHTGFTGTSLWVDPSQKLSVVFLTNAVHYGRELNMNELRTILHEAIYNEVL